MASEQTYNGWSNYETWAVNLWINNEESSHNWMNEQVEKSITASTYDDGLDKEAAVYDLANRVLTSMQSDMPDLGGSVWDDLLNSAFQDVNWREIADNAISIATEDAL